jgi:tetratricopeptide (TPR) repeat protein
MMWNPRWLPPVPPLPAEPLIELLDKIARLEQAVHPDQIQEAVDWLLEYNALVEQAAELERERAQRVAELMGAEDAAQLRARAVVRLDEELAQARFKEAEALERLGQLTPDMARDLVALQDATEGAAQAFADQMRLAREEMAAQVHGPPHPGYPETEPYGPPVPPRVLARRELAAEAEAAWGKVGMAFARLAETAPDAVREQIIAQEALALAEAGAARMTREALDSLGIAVAGFATHQQQLAELDRLARPDVAAELARRQEEIAVAQGNAAAALANAQEDIRAVIHGPPAPEAIPEAGRGKNPVMAFLQGIRGLLGGTFGRVVGGGLDVAAAMGQMGGGGASTAAALAGIFSGAALAVGALGTAAMAAADELGRLAERYAPYSPELALAQAEAQIYTTLHEIRRAQEYGGSLAEFVRAQVVLQNKVEDARVQFMTAIQPAVLGTMSVAEQLLPLVRGLADVLGYILGAFSPIQDGVNDIRKRMGAGEDVGDLGPLSEFLNMRFPQIFGADFPERGQKDW